MPRRRAGRERRSRPSRGAECPNALRWAGKEDSGTARPISALGRTPSRSVEGFSYLPRRPHQASEAGGVPRFAREAERRLRMGRSEVERPVGQRDRDTVELSAVLAGSALKDRPERSARLRHGAEVLGERRSMEWTEGPGELAQSAAALRESIAYATRNEDSVRILSVAAEIVVARGFHAHLGADPPHRSVDVSAPDRAANRPNVLLQPLGCIDRCDQRGPTTGHRPNEKKRDHLGFDPSPSFVHDHAAVPVSVKREAHIPALVPDPLGKDSQGLWARFGRSPEEARRESPGQWDNAVPQPTESRRRGGRRRAPTGVEDDVEPTLESLSYVIEVFVGRRTGPIGPRSGPELDRGGRTGRRRRNGRRSLERTTNIPPLPVEKPPRRAEALETDVPEGIVGRRHGQSERPPMASEVGHLGGRDHPDALQPGSLR